ncbi:acyltransferase family protein [Duganella sp. FT50W]|uniref:Acyltransferase family protein n=1 Tax=Duganella lactea TaxID=2692173 RepID=A0A6L8MDF5_9BURK|nr:acyltransferase [Duganella lactea]MYM35048.1 acyltransferase family protein [Duganella lactea]MYM80897.1 acyltransferase family protein [Duganella lactea]
MRREFSLYLDLVRVLAAGAVILYHSNLRLLTSAKLPFSQHGHAAVMVFFVLSGYVIAHIAQQRENTPLEYWASRLSRFYALAIPAVLLTPLLDLAGQALGPQFYQGTTTHGWAALRIATSLSFLNEVWLASIMSFSNVPYWSLCYEFWYYVLFAILAFVRGPARWYWASAVALLLGPKIMVLAPVWALGVLLQRWQRLKNISPAIGAALFACSLPAYGLFHFSGMTETASAWLRQLIGSALHHQMAFSKFFLTDYLLALIVACNFVGMRAIAPYVGKPLLWAEPGIRLLAGYTFSAYILHQPLLQFFAALFNGDPNQPWFYLATMTATLAAIVAIGSVTEGRRRYWRGLMRALLLRLMTSGTPPGGLVATASKDHA